GQVDVERADDGAVDLAQRGQPRDPLAQGDVQPGDVGPGGVDVGAVDPGADEEPLALALYARGADEVRQEPTVLGPDLHLGGSAALGEDARDAVLDHLPVLALVEREGVETGQLVLVVAGDLAEAAVPAHVAAVLVPDEEQSGQALDHR